MPRKQKHPTRVERLMAAMDRCAIARGEAQWTNGYRAAKGGAEEARLHPKEQLQWEEVGRQEAAFRRLAARLLRSARQTTGDEHG
jgi:hypothetical protein